MEAAKWQQANSARKCKNGQPEKVRNRGLRTGRPPSEVQNPQPPEVLGRVVQEVPPRNGVLGEVLGKVIVLPAP